MREVYCDRLADVVIATWARTAWGGRAECCELVATEQQPDVRLVCVPCLLKDSSLPPQEPMEAHTEPMHCGECFSR